VSRSGTKPLRHACGVPPPLSRGGLGIPESFAFTRKVSLFARGSPTRGAGERSEPERLYEEKPNCKPQLDSTSPPPPPPRAPPPPPPPPRGGETLLPLPHYKPKRSRPTATRHLSVHSVISLSPALSATAETHLQKEKPYTTGLI